MHLLIMKTIKIEKRQNRFSKKLISYAKDTDLYLAVISFMSIVLLHLNALVLLFTFSYFIVSHILFGRMVILRSETGVCHHLL